MAEFIKERKYVALTRYAHDFEDLTEPGAGYSFDCDAFGNLTSDLDPCALGNYNMLMSAMKDNRATLGEVTYLYKGIKSWDASYWEPAVIRCRCGEELTLYSSWANECEVCHLEYNGSGQELAPRTQWGEETGEHF